MRLVAIGYRYSRETVLFFVLTENAGKTEAGTPAVPDRLFLPEEDGVPPLSFTITLRSKSVSDLSSPDFHCSLEKQVIRAIADSNGKTHYLVKFDVTKDPSGR
jgi:hypothetical protein